MFKYDLILERLLALAVGDLACLQVGLKLGDLVPQVLGLVLC